jgi:hypothetical protein
MTLKGLPYSECGIGSAPVPHRRTSPTYLVSAGYTNSIPVVSPG